MKIAAAVVGLALLCAAVHAIDEVADPMARVGMWWTKKRDAYCYNFLKLTGDYPKSWRDVADLSDTSGQYETERKAPMNVHMSCRRVALGARPGVARGAA